MAKIRVYELAKNLNKDSKEIIEILKKNGVEVKNHMSSVTDEDAAKVTARVSGNKTESVGTAEPAAAKTNPICPEKLLDFSCIEVTSNFSLLLHHNSLQY